MGKLIIIEGTDGSGKETQSKLLYSRLKEMGYKVKRISFPNYSNKACYPVKMFLNGEFGNINNISPYASSSFYTVDRYASYKIEWEQFYKEGGIVISDRYTISNIIHQANRIKNEKEFNEYCDWLLDFEWNKFELPKPDKTIFLDVPYNFSNELIKNRPNKITGENKKDILEADENQKLRAYKVAKKITQKYNFNLVECIKDNKLKNINDIHNEIFNIIIDLID